MISPRENIRNNLSILLAQNKMTQKKLADTLHLSQTAVTNWIKGKNAPDIDTLTKICDIFGIGINEMISSPSEMMISEEIQKLTERYALLDPHGKELVNLIVDKELERVQADDNNIRIIETEESIRLIPIPFYDLPVSAGTGVYLQDDTMSEITVEASPLAEQADFALRVNGNSMEPLYRNDDILLIDRKQTVQHGECGIFVLNGEGFFKKLGKNQLISLNPDYHPISFGEYDTIECIGKVIGKIQQ